MIYEVKIDLCECYWSLFLLLLEVHCNLNYWVGRKSLFYIISPQRKALQFKNTLYRRIINYQLLAYNGEHVF